MSGRYRLEINDEAERQLAKLPPPIQSRFKAKILALADNPRPSGSTRFAHRSKVYQRLPNKA